MGQGSSTPASGASQHTFEATGARTSFAGELVGGLEDSTQSDSIRNAVLERKIQDRVTSELSRRAEKESTDLNELTSAMSAEVDASQSNSDSDPTLLEKASGSAAEKTRLQQLSRDSVSKEVAGLKQKLQSQKKLEKPDAQVEKAKAELVACLRMNDRRPLDCWREKEEFKRQVGRLEAQFIQRTVR